MKVFTRNCPNCCKLLTYSSYKNLWRANNKHVVCVECTNKKGRKNTKVSEFYKYCPMCNKKMMYADKYKLTNSIKYNKSCNSCTQRIFSTGRKQSAETRRKKRLATITYIKNKKGQISPAYNTKACNLFENINKQLNLNGMHAENGGEFHIKELGYWVDYYEPKLNLVIEYYEKHHNRYNFLEKDKIREREIIESLNCKLLIIKENDDLDTVLTKIKEVL